MTSAEWQKLDRQTTFLTRSKVSGTAQGVSTSLTSLDQGEHVLHVKLKGMVNCWQTIHVCVPFETTPKLLTHVTAHILHDPSINREDEPCGLCLLLAPSGQIVLKKYKHLFTVDYTHSTCQRLIKFSYAAASQPMALNPCGNVLTNCPQCPKGSNTIWKYNMAFHYIKKHAPLVPPREFDVLDFELEGLWVVWSNHCATNWVGIRWRKHIMLKLNISAVHSLCLCLQYVL